MGFALCPLAAGLAFESDVLRLEHEYGAFSHLMFIVCGLVNWVEFAVLLRFVGLGDAKPAPRDEVRSTAVTISVDNAPRPSAGEPL